MERNVEELKIEYLPLSDLNPYDKNARKHGKQDLETIVNSIEEFNFSDPIGVWSDKNIIVEGHGRYLAAKKLHMKRVPCIRLDHLTDEQRKAYALAHNRTAEMSMWDDDLLDGELDALSDLFDMTKFGFDFNDRSRVVEDNYDGDLPTEPKAKVGDIYLLGRHRLMCGDSTDINQVETLVDGQVMDMLLTDPPYNVDIEETAGKIMNDNMDSDDFRVFLSSAFNAARSVMKPGAVFHIWHAETEGYNFRGACADAGLTCRQQLIWVKSSPTLGRQDFQRMYEGVLTGDTFLDEEMEGRGYETCLYGWKDGKGHTWYKKRKEKDVLFFDKPRSSDKHPTMKPVLLFDYEMKCNTLPGEKVLDLFGGSGTTLIAAEQNGRQAFLMEFDPHYVDVIIDRFMEFTQEEVYLIRDGEKIPYSEVEA